MASHSTSIATAIRHQQSGNLEAAESAYRGILVNQPRNADALHLLGMIAYKRGQYDSAVELIRGAMASNPDAAAFYGNLGIVLKAQGNLGEAMNAYRKAVELNPAYAEAHCNLGNAFKQRGEMPKAISAYRRALELKPKFADAHNHLGSALRRQGKLVEAAAACRQALSLRPEYAEAHLNLGNVLRDQGHLDEATRSLHRAEQLTPNDANVHSNLGNCLQEQGFLDQAVAAYQRAIDLNPNHAKAHNNLGSALRSQGKLEAASASYRRALEIEPNLPDAHWNLALLLLSQAEFERGWEEYEWRWKTGKLPAKDFHQPLWDGGRLDGRTILVHAEQGMGDTLQFVRYLWQVKESGGTVVFECQRPLLRLLRKIAGVDMLIALGDELPAFDVHAPLLSLPRIFKTSLSTIPAKVPYLHAEPALVQVWKEHLDEFRGMKIGICWQGSPTWNRDQHRSIPLRHFARLARIPGVSLLSLQKGHGLEQLDCLNDDVTVTNFDSRLDEQTGPFVDTAAVMANLDLVVTCDTAIAHLAGGLGVPVWLAEEFVAEWRWLQDRADTPWYPTMRIFRQHQPGDWGDVFARIESALRNELRCSPSLVPLDAGQDGSRQCPKPVTNAPLIDNGPIRLRHCRDSSTIPEAFTLALGHHQTGELEFAEKIYRQILEVCPDHADSLHMVGVIATQVGKHSEAVDWIRRAIAVKPEAATYHNNLGVALKELKEHSEAEECCRKALEIQPNYADAHNNLGVTLREMGQLDEARDAYRQAVQIKPDFAQAHSNLGAVLRAQGKLAEAADACERALQIQPCYADAHCNLGAARDEQGEFAAAVASYKRALEINPDLEEAHSNLAMTWLLQGDLSRGLPEYEWRLQKANKRELRAKCRPRWEGSSLAGRTVMVFHEQGLGDTIQFIRFTQPLREMGANVAFVCPRVLAPLLCSYRGLDQLIPGGEPLPPFDVGVPLMSIPWMLNTTLETIPADIPYLEPDADLVRRWAPRLARLPGLRVGIAWQGKCSHRAIPLEAFAKLADVSGVTLVSLQKEEHDAVARVPFAIHSLGPDLDEESGPFMDTAAVMKNLDLVITCDTSIAHLAGALGTRVWVALRHVPHWCWLLGREDSPWYPTMRLFRQQRPGAWRDVFGRITAELESLVVS